MGVGLRVRVRLRVRLRGGAILLVHRLLVAATGHLKG